MTGLTNHKQAAFVVVPQLLEESPDFALKVAQDAWPQITNPKVKTGILKAFKFADHPSTLKVLDMGVRDSDGSVVAYALGYVSDYSGVKFPGFGDEYIKWYEENKDKTPEQMFLDNRNKRHPQYDKMLKEMIANFESEVKRTELWEYSMALGDAKYAYAIPAMIGIIDADNSYDTIYGIGYFGLGHITDVDYSPFYDGSWWRRWWERNKSQYPEEIRNMPIPEFEKTAHGLSFTPYPEDIDTVDGMIKWMIPNFNQLFSGYPGWNGIAQEFAKHKNPKAIPYLIAAIDADTTNKLLYDVGYYGLKNLTGVPYEQGRSDKWWKDWWQKNKHRYPEEVQALDIDKIKYEYLN